MRRLFLIALVALAAPCAGEAAGLVGLGVAVGEPTGVSLKVWATPRTAVDAAGGWSIGDEDWMYVHCDYLVHSYELDPPEFGGALPYYFGIGGRLLLHEGDESRVGLRIPVGLDYLVRNGRVDVFIEVAPIVDLVPSTDLDWSGAVGARFYF